MASVCNYIRHFPLENITSSHDCYGFFSLTTQKNPERNAEKRRAYKKFFAIHILPFFSASGSDAVSDDGARLGSIAEQ